MCIALLVPLFVSASPVVRSGESVTIGRDQVVEGDFYAAANTVTISGEVMGDVYAASRTVTLNAPVRADITVIGGITQLHASVEDDVRVIGGEVVLADSVGGDVVVLGGVLRVLSTASVRGDILFWGGELVIEGPVGGSIFGSAQTVRIDASVVGDVEMRASERLALGDRAEVLGSITYKGTNEIERAQNAVVVGNIQTEKTDDAGGVSFQSFFLSLFAVLFAALTALLVFRRHFEEILSDRNISYGLQGLIGLAVFVGFPFVSIVLMLSILGFFAGIFLLASYLAMMIISWIVIGAVLGSYALRVIAPQKATPILSVAAGILLLHLVAYVPLIGPLAAFAALLVGFGIVSSRLYRAFI